ncbi:unnamed protein product [Linum tenue]|uniref:Heparan-alpha-glucosaminide N-acetyltransferase catalytic domain-containing protein n=1 Tax=Linum tenue TaxID=586396 RepID=A0AAV0PEG8_9ROSI|nr:unnamed protein product [Linum tenue]
MENPKNLEEGLAHRESLGNGEKQQNEVSEHPEAEEKEEQQPEKQKSKRVATLDVFRGLTVVLMILVDDAGEAYPLINHSPWNGCRLADFVMPFFLFIVGMAIALALKRVPKKRDAVRRIFSRTLKLLFWGVLLQGGYSHAPSDLAYGVDMKLIRWCGILQRIALVYMIVALVETFTIKHRQKKLMLIFSAIHCRLGGFISFLIYMITTFALYVPDWSFVNHDEQKRYTVWHYPILSSA